MFQETYKKMIEIVNKNSKERLEFERADGIEYSIFNYPASKLLGLKNHRDFIKEAYYKVLDRPVDEENLEILFLQLDGGGVSRDKILHLLCVSTEAKAKKTKIDWEN